MLPPSAARGKRILVAEDDADLRELIIDELRHDPYSLQAAGGVAEALQILNRSSVDILVLDLNLPDGDGLDLCHRVREAGLASAIIMVTARCAPADRLLGLELGADDYLTKPFEPRELLIRVRNLLKRLQTANPGRPLNAKIARMGCWRLDLLQRRLVAADDRVFMLSGAEYKLLMRFLDKPNCVLSREDLLPERGATAAFDRSIDLHISRLRRKLAAQPEDAELILTVRGEGYVLTGPVSFE